MKFFAVAVIWWHIFLSNQLSTETKHGGFMYILPARTWKLKHAFAMPQEINSPTFEHIWRRFYRNPYCQCSRISFALILTTTGCSHNLGRAFGCRMPKSLPWRTFLSIEEPWLHQQQNVIEFLRNNYSGAFQSKMVDDSHVYKRIIAKWHFSSGNYTDVGLELDYTNRMAVSTMASADGFHNNFAHGLVLICMYLFCCDTALKVNEKL